jgi:hypothetical protein
MAQTSLKAWVRTASHCTGTAVAAVGFSSAAVVIQPQDVLHDSATVRPADVEYSDKIESRLNAVSSLGTQP